AVWQSKDMQYCSQHFLFSSYLLKYGLICFTSFHFLLFTFSSSKVQSSTVRTQRNQSNNKEIGHTDNRYKAEETRKKQIKNKKKKKVIQGYNQHNTHKPICNM